MDFMDFHEPSLSGFKEGTSDFKKHLKETVSL